ncbi:MAG: S-layer homology domain-containing protein [Patescibacteria group bacterium]
MANKKYKNNKEYYGDDIPAKGIGAHHEFFLFEPKTLAIIIITSVLTLLIAFFGEKGTKFLTSVISPLPEHAAFDGTTFPIKQVPNWVKLTEAERKALFNGIPEDKIIPIPTYNPTRLAMPSVNLKWNDSNDDAIRNEKITYSVPYMGSYRLDGIEGTGSHPAVDIKVPQGTPVYAIANGTVIKAQISSGGFGNHIVIQHNNFPSLGDQLKLVTLYSAYSHLSLISVNANDVIKKGQLIGFSGATGTATTPHLHFQIDSDKPAWHPYWPFTTADMQTAGYSFFEAINNALGQGNAIENTINPMRYVQKYGGEQTLMVSANPALTQALSAALVDEYQDSSFGIQLVGAGPYEEGSEIKVIVQGFDKNGNLFNKPTFKDDVQVSLLNGNGTLNRTTLSATNLRTGIANLIRVSNLKPGKEKIILRFRDREISSQEFEIKQKSPGIGQFQVTAEKAQLELNQVTSIFINVLDTTGNKPTTIAFDETPLVALTNSIGGLNFSSLKPENFSGGQATVLFTGTVPGSTEVFVTFKGQIYKSQTITVSEPPAPSTPMPTPATVPEQTETAQQETSETGTTTAEVVQPEQPIAKPVETPPAQIVVPTEPAAPPVTLPFSDVLADSKYFQALTELKSAGLVAGYADGTFHPDQEVSRAEAITFILRAINETIKENIKIPFSDVPLDLWFTKYISTAFELGFVKGYPDGTFKPQAQVTLSEFFTMVFVAAKTDIDPQIQITLPTGIDALAWYAPYLQEAIRRNILDVQNNTLQPDKPMTRGEIAEVLYRITKLEKEAAL